MATIIILSKGMNSVSNPIPEWNTDNAIEHAGKGRWGYSCCNIPELTTTMRHSAVFFSDNKNLNLINTDFRRIISIIKPFSSAWNMKTASALYQLTVHSENAYATAEQISEKCGLPIEITNACLMGDLLEFLLEKNEAENEFRFDGMYMNIIPILSLFDFK